MSRWRDLPARYGPWKTPTPTEQAARTALTGVAESPLGWHDPGVTGVRERAWTQFTPFLAFRPQQRKVIYTTNAIEVSTTGT